MSVLAGEIRSSMIEGAWCCTSDVLVRINSSASWFVLGLDVDGVGLDLCSEASFWSCNRFALNGAGVFDLCKFCLALKLEAG
ncbi:hypothetical protein Nepgr_020370 [Nepenthes gracilis]|uniref:Uncharacterized protein n=1 Tax=Nepenthes gracilis TaxID=150966 RepID=A0AAD3SXI1_NEPGR|nr:hypothetical protein Nepgr_020370 [Nepenthes gracilis]